MLNKKPLYLITGASGFIGSNIRRLLDVNSANYICLNINPDKRNTTYGVSEFGYADDLKYDGRNLTDFNILLIHCAWAGVSGGLRNDLVQVIENNKLLNDIINLIRIYKISNVTALGSQAEYGIPNIKIMESVTCDPKTLYGKNKLAHYLILSSACAAMRVEFKWIRVFSTYGPNDKNNWVIPYTIKKLHANEPVDLSDCSQTWDYLNVDDAVEAIIQVSSLDYSGVFNLGSGIPIILKQVILEIALIMNKTNLLKFGKRKLRADEPSYLLADISKIKKMTGWTPSRNIFDDLSAMVKHYAP
jgi:UDP-glucose 4-epimerase